MVEWKIIRKGTDWTMETNRRQLQLHVTEKTTDQPDKGGGGPGNTNKRHN